MRRGLVLTGAAIGGAARLLLLGLMLAMQASPGEGAQSFLLDLPTIGVYLAMGLFGVHLHIQDASDTVFHLIGMAVWIVGGLSAGYAVAWLRLRRMSGGR